jgi:hypothetical protein
MLRVEPADVQHDFSIQKSTILEQAILRTSETLSNLRTTPFQNVNLFGKRDGERMVTTIQKSCPATAPPIQIVLA